MVNPNEHQVQLIDEICRSTNYPRYWVAGRTMDTYFASEAGREVDVIFENHDLEDLWENING